MAFLVLTHAEVEQLLAMQACIEVMTATLEDLAQGTLSQPLRSIYAPPCATGVMAWMPAYSAGPDAVYGMKMLCVIPDNPSRGLDGHQGSVVLMDGVPGELRAVINAAAITAIRTAAVSAVATRLLAREDARVLALIGAGVQAERHLEAMLCVRPIERVRVAGRTLESAQRFVARMRPRVPCALEAVESAEAAVRDAGIVVTATTAREPVLAHAWLAPGTHVNAVGASRPPHREIDTATWSAAAVFVDRRESVEREAADYQRALEEGGPEAVHIKAEIGDVLLGRARGRTSADEITLFRSLGLAVEDVTAAQYVLQRARASGVGTLVGF